MNLSVSDLYRPDDAPTDDEIQAAIEYDPANAESEEEAEAATQAGRWKPTSTRSANWVMERLAEKRAAIEAKEAEATEMLARLDEERAKIEEWLAADTKRLRSGARHMEHLLTEWALTLREQHPDQATFKLPAGEVRTTARPMAVTKVDGKAAAEAAVEWARRRELDLNVKTSTTVDLAVMKPKVAVVEYLVLVHDPDLGEVGESKAWVQRPGLIAKWSQSVLDPDDGNEGGEWVVTDPANGEVIAGAIVREGLFVVDAESGEHLDFLAVTPDDISVKVAPA